MANTKKISHPELLSRAALALSLMAICLLIFRGPVSIVSAFLIPAIMVLLSKDLGRPYYVLTSLGLLLTTLIFFPTQIVFVMGYLLLSAALQLLFISKGRFQVNLIPAVLYISFTSLILFLGIRLTEAFFHIPLHQMMLAFSGGRPILYLAILFTEALLVCAVTLAILRMLFTRLMRLER